MLKLVFENCFQPGNILPSEEMLDPVDMPNNTNMMNTQISLPKVYCSKKSMLSPIHQSLRAMAQATAYGFLDTEPEP
jgi:hypothetical protein